MSTILELAGRRALVTGATKGIGRAVTDDKSLPKAEHKALQVAHAHTLSAGAKLIKLADKISNVRAVLESPPPEWSKERRLDYIAFCRNVVEGLRGIDATLEALFDEAAAAARTSPIETRLDLATSETFADFENHADPVSLRRSEVTATSTVMPR